MGDATKNAELRPPAIKAALRFWWRAINANPDLSKLKKKETEIFGGGGDNARKSAFDILVSSDQKSVFYKNSNLNSELILDRKIQKRKFGGRGINSNMNLLDYLAYGTYDFVRGGTVNYNTYITPGSKFKIIIYTNDTNIITKIEKTMTYLSLFGGLGAKTRNGFGQFRIKDLTTEIEINERKIKELISEFPSMDKSNHTAFSRDTKLLTYNGKGFDNWNEALAKLGEIYFKSRVNYVDGDNKKVANGLDNEHSYLARPYIAYPLQKEAIRYRDSGRREREFKIERHSKAFFFRVFKMKDTNEKNVYFPYILFMPYNYSEDSELLSKDKNVMRNIGTIQNNYKTYHDEFIKKLITNGMKTV